MAETEKVPADVLNTIAGQIRSRLVAPVVDEPIRQAADNSAGDAGLIMPFNAAPAAPFAELGETLAVWALDAEAVERFRKTCADLAQLAHATDRWHHQIKLPTGAVGFARTLSQEDDASKTGSSLREIFFSALAGKIDEAITLADKQVPDNMTARLLWVPDYHIHALWFCAKVAGRNEYGGDSLVLVVSVPPGATARLKLGEIISSHEFLVALASEEPVAGLL